MDSTEIIGKLAKGTMTDPELKVPPTKIPYLSIENKNRTRPLVLRKAEPGFLARIFSYLRGTVSVVSHFMIPLMLFLILLSLCYYKIVDPCIMKFSYYRHCQKDAFLYAGFLSRTQYKEDFICIMPGSFHHAQENGWNLDVEC